MSEISVKRVRIKGKKFLKVGSTGGVILTPTQYKKARFKFMDYKRKKR